MIYHLFYAEFYAKSAMKTDLSTSVGTKSFLLLSLYNHPVLMAAGWSCYRQPISSVSDQIQAEYPVAIG